MVKIITFLQGKKTYLVALAMGIVVALNHLGYVDTDTGNMILNFLVPTGLITLRAGIAKADK